MSFMETYQRWLSETAENEEVYRELDAIREDESAIEDRFYKELEFGS